MEGKTRLVTNWDGSGFVSSEPGPVSDPERSSAGLKVFPVCTAAVNVSRSVKNEGTSQMFLLENKASFNWNKMQIYKTEDVVFYSVQLKQINLITSLINYDITDIYALNWFSVYFVFALIPPFISVLFQFSIDSFLMWLLFMYQFPFTVPCFIFRLIYISSHTFNYSSLISIRVKITNIKEKRNNRGKVEIKY